LTGKPAFGGESISETVAAVLRDEIDWTALPATTPDRVRRLLGRCLHRDVKQRLQAIGEARIALDSADDWIGPVASSPRRLPPPAGRSRLLWGGGGWLIPVAPAASGWLLARTNITSPVVTRLSVSLPVPYAGRYETANLALSRDGRMLAYVGTSDGTPRLYVRPMDQNDVRPLAG